MLGSLHWSHLWAMFGIVAFGSFIPILPTGAAVSVSAVLASVHHPLGLFLVLVLGAAGAYIGDIATYLVLRAAGETLAHRVGWLSKDRPSETLKAMRRQIQQHELRVLLLSRLIPGGRIPVLLAAAFGGYSRRRYAIADIAAASLWSFVYLVIGLFGGVFPHTWMGIAVVILFVLAISLVGNLATRRSRARSRRPPRVH